MQVREWRAKNERQIVAELMQLVSLPNIASNKADIVKNADLLTAMFEKRGFAVSGSRPGIAGVSSPSAIAANAAGTLTFYMHYDGQPTEAKDWTMGQPFAPAAFKGDDARRSFGGHRPVDPDARIYARAVADDKGRSSRSSRRWTACWTRRRRCRGRSGRARRRGGGGLAEFRSGDDRERAAVRGDLAVIVDSPRQPSNLPTVFYGSRGADRRRDHGLRRDRRSAQRQLRQLRPRSGDGADEAAGVDEGRSRQRRHQELL